MKQVVGSTMILKLEQYHFSRHCEKWQVESREEVLLAVSVNVMPLYREPHNSLPQMTEAEDSDAGSVFIVRAEVKTV